MATKHSVFKKRIILLIAALLCFNAHTLTAWMQSTLAPTINAESSAYDVSESRLVIKGKNFQKGATVILTGSAGEISHGEVKVKNAKKIFVNGVAAADMPDEIEVMVRNPDGNIVTAHLHVQATDPRLLTADDVKRIIAQAVAQAEASGLKATIAVVDKEGNVLGVFVMTGATPNIIVKDPRHDHPRGGLEGPLPAATAPLGATLAAISKAVTGAFLSSQGHSFTSRTASFIVQEHFPPGIDFQSSGPLFGVQFSQLVVCSDINARSPLGLSADPGGIALYKNGLEVGGIGVEGDGIYTFDPDPMDKDQPVEELVALAGTRGFETPPEIQGDKIVVNGIRFPFVNTPMPTAAPAQNFNQLRGNLDTRLAALSLTPTSILDAQPSRFRVITLDSSIPAGRVDNRFFPFQDGPAGLTASDVQKILIQAARQAFIMRAAIRQPQNSPTEVNISVVDANGIVLGLFSTIDAPIFGFDVCVQKARTAAFFSKSAAGAQLRQAGFGRYVDAAAKDGIRLDGSIAFSDRAEGFLERPFYPDGINDTENGPFSVPIEDFSPFNVGLQLNLLLEGNGAVGRFLRTGQLTPDDCTGVPGLANGTQIFPGSVPLYKNGKLVGAVGVSGDGVDQDDLVATMGSAGFESPTDIRSDRVFVRAIRLPFTKFPRHPNR
jgi:uncharacterized protein GlcG (DUF336 family)